MDGGRELEKHVIVYTRLALLFFIYSPPGLRRPASSSFTVYYPSSSHTSRYLNYGADGDNAR